MLKKNFEQKADYIYIIFRIIIGLLFMQHGLQKLFGIFGGIGGSGQTVSLLSIMGLAGIIEFMGGLAIAFGFFTRLAAFIAAVEMIIAYFIAHVPKGFVPILNGGELALLYFASFLLLIVNGAGKLSLEKALLKKEIF